MNDDFYVGYLPKAPQRLAVFVRKIVIGLGVLAMVIAVVLAFVQNRFASSAFEFGKIRNFEGVLETHPYPSLLVARPASSQPQEARSRYLLVAPGKHGADGLLVNFDGQNVRLQGQLIYRAGGTMVEVVPGSITGPSVASTAPETVRELGTVRLTGEIVDGKCYLGVMNPGNGKVHRECAARCLSGGVPPLFVTSDRGEQLLLVGSDGAALAPDALREFVAEPITIDGDLQQRGDARLLKIDPSRLRHAP